MAGERRRQTARQAQPQQPPQRVQQAAQAMNYPPPSGVQRGYVPQNTNGYRTMGSYTGPVYPGQGYNGPQQTSQNTGGMQYVSSMTGSTRGFVMQGNTGSMETAKKPAKGRPASKALIITVIVIVLAAVAGVAYGITSLIDRNKKDEVQKAEQSRIEEIRSELGKYDNLYFPGVYVDGIHLGGMTPEQAKNYVQSQIQQRNDAWYVDLSYQGNVFYTIKASMLGMEVNPDEVLNKAWEPGHYGTLDERYQTMLRLREEPYEDYTAQPSGDTTVIDSILAEIKRQLDRPATDAAVSEFRADLNDPFIFTDEINGMNLNTETLKTRLYHMVSTMESGLVEIIPDIIEPAVKRADLEKIYAKRSSVYTRIDKHSPENRNDNIRLAFSKINGYVLNPGKKFSFNKVVGNRSTKNGFKTAIEYVYGEHVEGVGGGACQASTTVYQAAIKAGLEINERHAHSDSVSYTEYGKDATVSDTKGHEKDLRFTNTTDHPIYFKAEVVADPSNKNRLIAQVTLYGEDLGNVRYDLISELVETIPAPLEPQYIKDKNKEYVIFTDEQKSVSEAKEGYVYRSYRIKYEDGIETERKELFTDTYKPKAEKIYVGVYTRD